MSRTEPGIFPNRWLPYVLLAPQLLVTLVFFVWPSAEALIDSFYQVGIFGIQRHFVGLDNFAVLLADGGFVHSFWVTLIYAGSTALLAMSLGLLFAVLADGVLRGRQLYRLLFLWPYAVAPAIAAVLWMFLFAPQTGLGSRVLIALGVHWNYAMNGTQAMLLVIALTVWQQLAYNFLFFTAGLQAIPPTLLEAATLDGAGPFMRFRDIVFPLLAPTTFFLLVMNTLFVFFDTFSIIDLVTGGGPAGATETLVYKVYRDGFQNLNLGSAAAQSILLMIMVSALTAIQFRLIERRVHYR